MAEVSVQRAEESVAVRFSRAMNAATSPWGVVTDFTVASALAAIPLVLIVRQIGGGETRSPLTYALGLLAALPVVLAIGVSIALRDARASVVAWLAAQPFPIDNVNALLVGLTDSFEITFARGAAFPTRERVQRLLDAISDDTLATEASEDERRVSVQIGVIESKRVPLRSTYQRWTRFQRLVTEVLVPLSRDVPISSVRLV